MSTVVALNLTSELSEINIRKLCYSYTYYDRSEESFMAIMDQNLQCWTAGVDSRWDFFLREKNSKDFKALAWKS